MTLKFSDLKPGDKINYKSTINNKWCEDIGTYVRSENGRHWFKWHDHGYAELSIFEDEVSEIRYVEESAFSDKELIEELRKRGFNGTLTKTVTQSITL